ncbi:hypothetical protein [Streptomyces chiangmaiensis]|uniref:hypothetical protein n=1 Tax=Streptomyces chiangmaiensis TaxID=766497 RepID=UPI00363E0EC4
MSNSSRLPKQARLLAGASSAMNGDALAYSPPVEKPRTGRVASSRTGASTPIAVCDGIRRA